MDFTYDSESGIYLVADRVFPEGDYRRAAPLSDPCPTCEIGLAMERETAPGLNGWHRTMEFALCPGCTEQVAWNLAHLPDLPLVPHEITREVIPLEPGQDPRSVPNDNPNVGGQGWIYDR